MWVAICLYTGHFATHFPPSFQMSTSPRRLVIKFGSGILTRPGTAALDESQFANLCQAIAILRQQGHEVIVVSSGAVAAGLQVLLSERAQDRRKAPPSPAAKDSTSFGETVQRLLCIGIVLLTATSAVAQSTAQRRPRPAPRPAAAAAPAPPAPAPVPIIIPPPPANTAVCDAISRTVELNLKTLGQDYANATLTKGAAQATQVANETANDIAILNINLGLLTANRCSPWVRPVGMMNYGGSALACAKAAPADKPAQCNQDDWKAAF